MSSHVSENHMGETEVYVNDGDAPEGEAYNGLYIHPWKRNYPHLGLPEVRDEVYLAAIYTKDAEGKIPSYNGDGALEDNYGNVILESEDFIEAVLAAFPDRLQRKEQ